MVAEELYILKHKDLDVAMVKIRTFSGRTEYILEMYAPGRTFQSDVVLRVPDS